MHSLFIVGTDTDAGKTVVTAALLAAARRTGCDAVPMKPVQTGCRGRPLRAPDLEFCLRMARLNPTETERALMCPARYAPACSPHLAAEQAGKPIRSAPLVRAWTRLRARHECVLAEGAGGLMVPLSNTLLLSDLILRFGAPVLLVARNRLGALNHTLLTLDALATRGVPTLGYILVDSPDAPRSIRDNNETTLRNIIAVPCLGRLGPLACLSKPRPDPDVFERATRRFAEGVWSALESRTPDQTASV